MQSSHEYIDRHAQSLWEISVNQPCTDILKSAKKDDFEIQPWNNNE